MEDVNKQSQEEPAQTNGTHAPPLPLKSIPSDEDQNTQNNNNNNSTPNSTTVQAEPSQPAYSTQPTDHKQPADPTQPAISAHLAPPQPSGSAVPFSFDFSSMNLIPENLVSIFPHLYFFLLLCFPFLFDVQINILFLTFFFSLSPLKRILQIFAAMLMILFDLIYTQLNLPMQAILLLLTLLLLPPPLLPLLLQRQLRCPLPQIILLSVLR